MFAIRLNILRNVILKIFITIKFFRIPQGLYFSFFFFLQKSIKFKNIPPLKETKTFLCSNGKS